MKRKPVSIWNESSVVFALCISLANKLVYCFMGNFWIALEFHICFLLPNWKSANNLAQLSERSTIVKVFFLVAEEKLMADSFLSAVAKDAHHRLAHPPCQLGQTSLPVWMVELIQVHQVHQVHLQAVVLAKIPAPGGSTPWRKSAPHPRASNLWHRRRYDDRQVLTKRENGNLLNLLYRAVLLTQKGNRSTSLPSWGMFFCWLYLVRECRQWIPCHPQKGSPESWWSREECFFLTSPVGPGAKSC